MGIKARIAAALGRWLVKPEHAPAMGRQSVDDMVSILRAQLDDDFLPHARINKWDVQRYFRRWQYAAATAVADAGCLVEYEVQTLQDGQWAEDTTHPVSALLRRPNAWMTMRELIYYLFLDLLYVGEHYWYIARNGVDEPAEIWPLMGEVEPQRSETEFLTGYKVTTRTQKGQRTRTFKTEEIVPFKLPMLQNVYEGMSPMRAAGGSVKLDDELLKAQWHTFRQGVFPFAVLLMSEQDPVRRRELLGRFNELYAGAKKSGKTIGINKDTMDIKILSHKPREMDFGRSADRVRDAITAMFRVPPVLMGLTRDVQNRATAEAAEYVFAKWNIRPKLALIEDRINMDLCLRCYGPDVRVKFYNQVPADREQDRADQDLLLKHYALTINEAREVQGYEPVDWGERPLVPASVAPLGAATPAEQGPARSQSQAPRGFSRANRRVIAMHFRELHDRFARSCRKMWAGLFADLGARFLETWDRCREDLGEESAWIPEACARAVRDVLDPSRVAEMMRERSRPCVTRALVTGGSFDAEFADVPGSATWGARSAALLRYAALYDASYYRPLAEATRRRVTDLLEKGTEQKAPGDELRAEIARAFALMKTSRAADIAATEAPKLLAAGAEAFREAFEVEYKQWIAPEPEQGAPPDGQVLRKGEPFQVGGERLAYPGAQSRAEEGRGHQAAAVAVALPRNQERDHASSA